MTGSRLDVTALVVGFMFIVIGTLFLMDEYDVLELDAIFVLPVLVIGLGIAIILGGRTGDRW
jgi:hypothetical protein